MQVGEACFGKKPADETLTDIHVAVLLQIYKQPRGTAVKMQSALPCKFVDNDDPEGRAHRRWVACMMALVDLRSTGFVHKAPLDGSMDGWPDAYRLTVKGSEALRARYAEMPEPPRDFDLP